MYQLPQKLKQHNCFLFFWGGGIFFAFILIGQYSSDRKRSGRERGGRNWERSTSRDLNSGCSGAICQCAAHKAVSADSTTVFNTNIILRNVS